MVSKEMEQYNKYRESLGYRNDIIYFEEHGDGSIYSPEIINILALWDDGSYSAHFRVANEVFDAFDSFDEIDDPALVDKIWVADADYAATVNGDPELAIEWKQVACEAAQ